MRRRETYWSLYETVEKRQIDDLKTDQVEAIFTALSDEQKIAWLMWREGFKSWKPLMDFPAEIIALRKASDASPNPAPPAAPESSPGSAAKQKPTSASTKTSSSNEPTGASQISPSGHRSFEIEEVDNLGLAISKQSNNEDDRDNVRFRKRFEVRIHSNNRVYPNITLDISMRGMRLQESLPKNLPSFFTVELKVGESLIPLICSEVRAEGPANRLQIQENDYTHALKSALLSLG